MVAIEHTTIEVEDLSTREREVMFGLMQDYYLGVRRETFERDLSEKEHVMLLRDRAACGRIVGFSTLMRLRLEVCGQQIDVIFSGDTVVDERSRHSRGLAYEVTRYFQTLAESSVLPLYYVLICKGWRTYRILPFLFRQFSPRSGEPTQILHRQVMNAFGARRYPGEYRPETGLIVFEGEAQRIKPGSSEAISPLRSDEHAQFFRRQNPSYLRGDELVCVARVEPRNFTEAFEKLLAAQREICEC
jgi:hypothetical protein